MVALDREAEHRAGWLHASAAHGAAGWPMPPEVGVTPWSSWMHPQAGGVAREGGARGDSSIQPPPWAASLGGPIAERVVLWERTRETWRLRLTDIPCRNFVKQRLVDLAERGVTRRSPRRRACRSSGSRCSRNTCPASTARASTPTPPTVKTSSANSSTWTATVDRSSSRCTRRFGLEQTAELGRRHRRWRRDDPTADRAANRPPTSGCQAYS
jgi:hypothetical protein